MHRASAVTVVCLLLQLAVPVSAPGQSRQYPPAAKADVADDYFGTAVPDPYRWLEDLESSATREWVSAQNELTEGYLAKLPSRGAIRRRLTELWNFPRLSVPRREGGQLFYSKNTGLQRQSVLYTRDGVNAAERLVIDPNTLSPDGSIAFTGFSAAPDGRHLAYGLSAGGSDFRTLRVRELASGRVLPDSVRWVKFSGTSWTQDGQGFFYSRYPEPEPGKELSGSNVNHRVYYHRVGTPQSADLLIYADSTDPNMLYRTSISEDGRFLWIAAARGTSRNRLYYVDLRAPERPVVTAPAVRLIPVDDADYVPLGSVGDTLYVRTELGAPKRRIVAITLPDTARANWRTVVAESDNVIKAAALVGGRIVVHYLVDVKSRLTMYGLDGRPMGEIALPGIGAVGDFSGRADTPELFYGFESFLTPATVFRYDFATGKSTPFAAPRTAFGADRYVTRQVFYTSADGTRVPMFITARKGLALDGSHPALLYAYGGFAISITPSYSPAVAGWLDMGGVYAVPSLRGGAEYGEAWHHAGMKEKKQNVFDDFIAAAEYLIKERYTSRTRLAIQGGSNGGLLVGAVMTQRPELFAVALPAVGVLDMLRYQKFTGGKLWTVEYGSADDSTAFQHLIDYSPLHNVKPGTCYPATLITTADHDDRVVPSHSYKFGAALQAAQGCDRPIFLRVEVQGSHGYRATDKQIAEAADVWAFTLENLRLAR